MRSLSPRRLVSFVVTLAIVAVPAVVAVLTAGPSAAAAVAAWAGDSTSPLRAERVGFPCVASTSVYGRLG